MSLGISLFIAMAIDAFLGEPDWVWRRLPHPAVLMGRLISRLEERLNRGTQRRAAGVLLVLVLLVTGIAVGGVLSFLGPLAEILVTAVLLAQRSLVIHVAAVADGLRQSLSAGRRAVAMIVSRDTAGMEESAVARSAIESAAENLSDGVIAPAFWFLVAGLPGLVPYKFINTADSMVGYRTERYADFGWAAAKLDDLLNLIPARLAALLIALGHGTLSQWQEIGRDARRHKSPNAGWPEAAMARAIDVALAGPRAYDGVMRPLAWVNEGAKTRIGAPAVEAAIGVLWRTWAMMLGLALVLGLIWN
ncbi:MAG: cobalamin biosynthesis protein [Sulfitobacter sp.]|nr:cobalamin biosynthesis protein [Sulfitobacter sp.]